MLETGGWLFHTLREKHKDQQAIQDNFAAECRRGVLSRCLTSYIVCKQCINISVQKGGVPEQSVCIEQTSIHTQQLHETRVNHGDLENCSLNGLCICLLFHPTSLEQDCAASLQHSRVSKQSHLE